MNKKKHRRIPLNSTHNYWLLLILHGDDSKREQTKRSGRL